jgi:STE24 endopeptidase
VQADTFALEITCDRESFISSMEKLADQNLADRNPHPVDEFVFYSHPCIGKRVAFAREYRLPE